MGHSKALVKYLDIFEVRYTNENLTLLVKPNKNAFDKYWLNLGIKMVIIELQISIFLNRYYEIII